MDPELSQRLDRVESHLAHLERQYEELNQVVIEQGAALKKLQSQQQRISQTIDASELERIKATNPRPPHYQ
jgi:SlyX protein